MAGRKVGNTVAVAMVALLVVAVASGAAGLSMCGVDQAAVETCRSYCSVGSREGTPKPECCTALVHADFGCLCQYKSALRAYKLDVNRAMQIPSKCKIDGAPTSC